MSKPSAAFVVFDLGGTLTWRDTFLACSRYRLYRRPPGLLCFADHGIALDLTRLLAAAAAVRGLPVENWGGRAAAGWLVSRLCRTGESAAGACLSRKRS